MRVSCPVTLSALLAGFFTRFAMLDTLEHYFLSPQQPGAFANCQFCPS
ncbi:MAG: hypothetical protein LBO79_02360 [Zoogloeaceae bacterium]|jgi:hypothetical protein|nr:hypothetical protein [Zoogloeaceae bacterium]